jgi:hypothetical protein
MGGGLGATSLAGKKGIYMKSIYFIILLLIASIFTSCDDDSNTLVTSDTDGELQKQIVGTWQMQNGTRTLIYYSNFTFIDSSASFVAQGNYSINDSIIYKSNINVRFIDPSYYPSPGYNFTFEAKYLNLSNNQMTEIPITIFEPDNSGNNSQLWGRWSRILWTYQLKYSEPSYLGRLKIVMNFTEASHSAEWWSKYLDRSTNNNSDTLGSNNLIYNPPSLDLLGTGDYLVEVKFMNNKMYWWEPYEPILYNRMK